jgi:hypothetical protein
MTYCEAADKILTDWYLGHIWINGHSQTPDECDAVLKSHQSNCAICRKNINVYREYFYKTHGRYPEQEVK